MSCSMMLKPSQLCWIMAAISMFTILQYSIMTQSFSSQYFFLNLLQKNFQWVCLLLFILFAYFPYLYLM